MTDGLEGVANALTARSAGAGSRNDAPLESEIQADVDRRRVRHHLDVARRSDALHRMAFEHPAEHLDRLLAPRRRTVGNAHAPVADGRIVQQPGVGERHLAGAHRKERDAPHRARHLARIMRRRAKIVDRRAETGIEHLEAVPFGHAPHRIASRAQPRFDSLPGIAERGDPAHASNHHPPVHIMPPMPTPQSALFFHVPGRPDFLPTVRA